MLSVYLSLSYFHFLVFPYLNHFIDLFNPDSLGLGGPENLHF